MPSARMRSFHLRPPGSSCSAQAIPCSAAPNLLKAFFRLGMAGAVRALRQARPWKADFIHQDARYHTISFPATMSFSCEFPALVLSKNGIVPWVPGPAATLSPGRGHHNRLMKRRLGRITGLVERAMRYRRKRLRASR